MPRSLLVCHLNSSEVKQFQEHGIRPNCDHHAHIKLNDAHERCGKDIGYGSARWVDDQYRYITDISEKVWRSLDGVLQLVNGVIEGRRGHFPAYPIPACGAHTRRLSVSQVNHIPQEANA